MDQHSEPSPFFDLLEHKLNYNLLTGRKTGIMVDGRRTVLGRLERIRHEKSKGQYRFVFKNGILLVFSQEILFFHTLLKKDGDCIVLEFSREEILSSIAAYSLYGTYGLPLEFTLDEASGKLVIQRTDIPHEKKQGFSRDSIQTGDIQKAIRLIRNGKTVDEIAADLGIERDLADQICRLYLTHPGVTAEGIMTKMGL